MLKKMNKMEKYYEKDEKIKKDNEMMTKWKTA